MKVVNTKAINDLNDSLLVSIKLYYNIHLKGGIENFSYYLSAISQEHLSYQDHLLHPNP
ncbi:hypothetical protein GNZ01_07330 [Escherichia coli]|uniref:Uncharacterized protein n=1 Tax=Escherichia coli TaxID=562 RepID=A0AAJ3CWY5_ECOLX|nr:hypothetical protein [Escherichia coli]MUM71706.1 hypothetical protein [Escherichia coli]MUM83063.1 hypothetical protein [Escherichia coli]